MRIRIRAFPFLVLVAAGCTASMPSATAFEFMKPKSGEPLTVGCKSFEPNGPIPVDYTRYGSSKTPVVTWSDVPAGTKSLALILEDPDAPGGSPFVHWVVTNIDPAAKQIPGSGQDGANSEGVLGYIGPKPQDASTHHYYFELFALDEMLPSTAKSRDDVMKAMLDHVIAKGEFVSTYQKP
jgi:Raf kinase inhibitor-like YbhB/YbcL family protein